MSEEVKYAGGASKVSYLQYYFLKTLIPEISKKVLMDMEQIDRKSEAAGKIREAVKALNRAVEEATELGLKVELAENSGQYANGSEDVQLYGPRWAALITETIRY